MNESELARLTEILDSLDFDFGQVIPEREEPRGLLYHYTTPEGLLGIMKSGSIRATHVRYLNDKTELKHALSQEFEDHLLDTLFPVASKEKKESLRKLRRDHSKVDEVYVASFTDDAAALASDAARPGDRLSQWRAYSNPAGGFSLGFDSKLVMGGWQSKGLRGIDRSLLLRCRYSPREKRDAARKVGAAGSGTLSKALESCLDLFRKKVGREPDLAEGGFIESWSDAFALGKTDADYFIWEAARFKDEAFSEEHEWRIVVQCDRQRLLDAHCFDTSSPIIHFRAGRYGLTPYIDLPLGFTSAESPLRRIIVGPSQQEKEALEGVKLLLQCKGIKVKTEGSPDGVEVVPSRIPYRN